MEKLQLVLSVGAVILPCIVALAWVAAKVSDRASGTSANEAAGSPGHTPGTGRSVPGRIAAWTLAKDETRRRGATGARAVSAGAGRSREAACNRLDQ